ncbi:MAG: YlxR family protein [Chloroflexota bacterium]|nr:YlxR family protein [Chloroflexota bacterium]
MIRKVTGLRGLARRLPLGGKGQGKRKRKRANTNSEALQEVEPSSARPTPPQRSCIACRRVKAKRELVRIVRTPAGTVQVDERGKEPGRGAYLCRERDCWEAGLKKSRLARALSVDLGPKDVEGLWQYFVDNLAVEKKG